MAEEKAKEYQLVVFAVGNEEFGVDISQVREIVRLMQIVSLPKASAFIEGVVNLRGQVLAVIDLAKKLGLTINKRGDHSRIIIVEVGGHTVGMIVDSVSEVLRLSANCAEDVPNLVNTEVPEHYIKGIGKLKDRLLVLLDLNNIITPEEFKNVERHLKAVPA
ncbi:MAG TPA: chemotaxis protein CheW [Candidatus Omnitrophota bacterium]|nr:chemotaxis protein CheW [Candidatus Omnitrophota bacterium]HRZ15494.1 chemotaxis protein CheW [Candidatus Omnitrophota bacterium]